MKKDINYLLFGLLIIALVSMVAVVLYFDSESYRAKMQLKNAVIKINEYHSELNKTRSDVYSMELEMQKTKNFLSTMMDELYQYKERVSTLSEHYAALEDENTDLERKNEELEQQLEEFRIYYMLYQNDSNSS